MSSRTRSVAGTALLVYGVFALYPVPSRADEAWQWRFTDHTLASPPVIGTSRVELAGTDLAMSFVVPLHHHDVVINDCHAQMRDVVNVDTIHTKAGNSLLVTLKDGHPADCKSGNRPVVILPADDLATVKRVASALTRAVAQVTPPPTPQPTRPPSPEPTHTSPPSPTPTRRIEAPVALHTQPPTAVPEKPRSDARAEPTRTPRTVARLGPLPDVNPMLIRRGSSRLAIGQSGTAEVRVRIGADGTPENAQIISTTNRRLVPAAIETAISSSYTPAVHDGKRISADYIATFHFDGSDPGAESLPVWMRTPAPSDTPQPGPLPTQNSGP